MKGSNFQSRPAARAARPASLGLSIRSPPDVRAQQTPERERLFEMRDDGDEKSECALSQRMKIGQLISIFCGIWYRFDTWTRKQAIVYICEVQTGKSRSLAR